MTCSPPPPAVSNLLTALALALIYRILPPPARTLAGTFLVILKLAIYFNLLLFLFNLIPVFPWTGPASVRAMLPLNQAYLFSRLEPVGPLILMGIIMAGR